MKNIITTVLIIGSLFFLFFQNYYDDRIEEMHQQNTSRIDSINTYIDSLHENINVFNLIF